MPTPNSSHSADLERIFPGDSQMAQRMRAFDWSAHELGSPLDWPQSLRLSLKLCLTSPSPMVLWWGPNLTFLYNDAAIPLLGEAKHPRALGQPGRESWREVWETVGPILEGVWATGHGTAFEDVAVYFNRRLPAEEVFIRLSCGPILADDNRTVDGIFTPCTETTSQAVSARRLETLRKLGIRAVEDGGPGGACQDAALILEENRHDIPFAAIYLVDDQRSQAVLTATAGLSKADLPLPQSVSLSAGNKSPWPLRFVLRSHRPEEVDLAAIGVRLPGGPWPDLAEKALVLPMMAAGSDAVAGFLVIGVSSRQVLDASYRTFFDLVATHIGTAVVDAQAHETERRRAEALAEVDRAKTTFMSNVSHEFRAPLTLILGPLEEELRGQPYSSERLQLAHRNSLRLLKLVNSLLDYSRIEAGRIDANYEPVDLATFTAELVSNFRAAIEKAGMELVVQCPPLPEPVYVDREMWEKIVLNLLSNALKFTLQGTITVTQKIQGPLVELSVQDTGSGIPAKDLPHIFERFYRVKWTKGRTLEGSGIGLALVQELVKLHGGSIRVESIPDQGSTLTVAIPLGHAHLPADRISPARDLVVSSSNINPFIEEASSWLSSATAEEALAESYAPGEPGSSPRPRASIVWAEDNDDMRDYVRRLLQGGYEVKAVANATEALAAVRRHPPDLVLTDIMMPRGDGFDLLRELRADPRTRVIPVVLLSARAGEEARIEGREAGADDYVVKPFAARELLARIASNVNLARVRRESEQRISGLVESAMDAIISIDDAQRIVLFNRAAAAMFRCPAADAIGSPLERFIPERFRAAHRQHIARFAKAGTTSRAMGHQLSTLWGLRADGEEFPIEAAISQVQLDWSRQMTVIVRDITERQKAEVELRESRERIRGLVESAMDAIISIDEAQRIILFNQAAEAMFRCPAGKAMGLPIEYFIPERFRAAHRQHIRRFSETGVTSRAMGRQLGVLWGLRDDGEEFPIEASISQLSMGGGRQLTVILRDITERYRQEQALVTMAQDLKNRVAENARLLQERDQALQEGQEMLSQALKVGHASIFDWQIQADETCWTADLLSLYGLSGEETDVHHWQWQEGVISDDREALQASLKQSFETGDFNHDFRIRRVDDGEIRWISGRAKVIFDPAGQPVRMTGTQVDVSDRKETQAALEESRLRQAIALEAGHATVWEMDGDSRTLRGSENLAAFLGYVPDRLRAISDWLSLIHEDQRSDLARTINETFEGKRDGYRYEWRIQARDGSWHWFLCQDKAVDRDAQGRAKRLIGTYTNIDERKQAELKLQDSERRLSLALAAGNSTVWEMDVASGIIAGSDSLFTMYGFAPGELRTLSDWAALIHPDDRQGVQEKISDTIQGKTEGFSFETRLRCKDSTWCWNLSQATVAERDAKGRARRLVGTHTNIDARKRIEEEIQRLNTELEQRVRERTAELERSNEALLHSNMELQQFANATAHDLQTPLRSIVGFAQLLQREVEGVGTEQIKEFSSIVVDNTRRLQTLIDNLLAYTRLEHQGLPFEPVDLQAIADEVVDSLSVLIHETGAEVHCGPLPTLPMDRSQITQVLQNLVENGIKYNKSKPPRVSIAAEFQEDQWLFSVADNGIGIDPRHHERIFEVFRRLHTYHQVPGAGIGLALCRRIVERHGGRIWVESRPGEGSTFYFTLLVRDSSE